jgi:hypothetical protein
MKSWAPTQRTQTSSRRFGLRQTLHTCVIARNANYCATVPAIGERIKQLNDELESSPQQRETSTRVAEKLEAEFYQ